MYKTDWTGAGPELDTLVAEQVLGWKFDPRWSGIVPPAQTAGPQDMWQRSEFGFEPRPGAAVSGLAYNGDLTRVHVPRFSSDIAAAWTLLAIFNDVPIVLASTWNLDGANVGWMCRIGEVRRKAATPEVAICLAALAAAELREKIGQP